MMLTRVIPILVILSFFLFLISACAHLVSRGRGGRRREWCLYFSLVFAGVLLLLEWAGLYGNSMAPLNWMRGWVGPRDLPGSLNIGIYQDSLGMAVISVGFVLFVLVSFSCGARGHRFLHLASAWFSLLGLALCWSSLTMWLCILGLGFAVLGSLVAVGGNFPREDLNWNLLWALTACTSGALIVNGPRAGWGWGPLGNAPSLLDGGLDFAGGVLLVVSLVHLIPVFPFFGSTFLKDQSSSSLFQIQVAPMIAVSAVFTRADQLLRQIGVFPNLGGYFLAVALLTLVAGGASRKPTSMLSAWVSGGFAVALSAHAFLGPRAGIEMILSISAVGLLFAIALERLKIPEGPTRKNLLSPWMRGILMIGMLLGTGTVGSVSAGAWVRVLSSLWEKTVGLSAFSVVFFVFITVGWRLSWLVHRLRVFEPMPWKANLGFLFLVCLTFGWVWEGSLSGGVIWDFSDQIMPSALDEIFHLSNFRNGVGSIEQPALVLYGILLISGFTVAALTSFSPRSFWDRVCEKFPHCVQGAHRSYGMEWLGRVALRFSVQLGSAMQLWLDRRLWDRWIPFFLGRSAARLTVFFSEIDAKLSKIPGRAMFIAVDAAARAAQLTQSGDVQWYLFIALGFGLGLFVLFLRS